MFIKRVIILSISLLMLFMVAGCNTRRPSTETTTIPIEVTAPTEPSATDPAIISTTQPENLAPEFIETAWVIAEKLGQVHKQQFDKARADITLSAYFAEVRFPSITFPDEVLCITAEKDTAGNYMIVPGNVYFEPAEDASDSFKKRLDSCAFEEKNAEFLSAEIRVTTDDIRSSGCKDTIGSSEYKTAAATVYGDKLAAYYRSSLSNNSPFCCYDVRCVGIEADEDYEDTYIILIGFRFRDILLNSYLFNYVPIYDDGTRHPDFEGWMVGWTLITVDPNDDGCFVGNAFLNGAG